MIFSKLFLYSNQSVRFKSIFFKRLFVLLIMLVSLSQFSSAQKLLHTFQLNGGLVSNQGADIYLGKLDYLPQLKWDNDVFRVGLNASTFYTRKSLEATGGVNFSWRVKNFTALNGNLPFGGLYLRPAFEVATSSEKILSGTLSLELTQVSVNISYGRDFEFDNNLFSTGFAFFFSKADSDEDE